MDNKLFYASREHGQVCNESSRGRVMPGTGGQEELPEMRMEVSLFRRWAAAKPLLTVRRRDTLFVSPGVATKVGYKSSKPEVCRLPESRKSCQRREWKPRCPLASHKAALYSPEAR